MSRFSAFARNLFADEALYPRPNVARPISDFRDNYRGTTASTDRTNQFDAKVDWSASSRDKLYVRYSRQTAEASNSQTVMPLALTSAANNPSWSVGANWNRIIGAAIVNDLLVGYSDSSNLSEPIDLLGLGKLNNRLGIPGPQAVRGLSQIQIGNNISSHRQRRDRHQQLQRGVPGQRAAHVVARPSHAEVRRVVELLPE